MESLASDLRQMQRTPLHDSHVEAIREIAETRNYAAGELVINVGDRFDR